MTTVRRWQEELRSRLGVGEGSSTSIPTKKSPDVKCPEDLEKVLSNSITPVPFCPSPSIASKSAPLADPKIPRYDGSDSGIGLATPSSRSEPIGSDLPGTELKYFKEPITGRLNARFFDIKVLYSQPLLDFILKRRKDPGDISMKATYLGLDWQSIEPYIVIQCKKNVAGRVNKFFAQSHVKEELSPDFQVFVLEKALSPLTDDEAIQVLADSVPNRTCCGTPIRLMRGKKSVTATFGGVVVVETSYMSLVGLTAAHSLKKLHGSPILQPLQDDREELLSSSSSEISERGEDSDSESILTTEDSVQHLEHSINKGPDTTALQNTLKIGTVTYNTFSAPMAHNYDWAIIDLSQHAILPNGVVLDEQLDSSNFGGKSDLVPVLLPLGNPCVSLSRQVLVLKQGARSMGEMSLETSLVLISPGSSFVEVYDLTMKHGSSLIPGDSGSWVVDAKTSVLYGHVVSTDAFGEAQVMPIHSTLESIKVHMNAARVFLPNRDEIQMFQETSGTAVPANLESSLTSDAYINDLGYVAGTAPILSSHIRKRLDQSQRTDPQIRKKHNSDTTMQMDGNTTDDIIPLDGENPIMQHIQPTPLPKEPPKPMSTRSLPRENFRLRSNSLPSSNSKTLSSISCLCSGSTQGGSAYSGSSIFGRCSHCSFRVGSPPPGRPAGGDYDKNTLENFHLSNLKSPTSITNVDDPLGDELGAQWEGSKKLGHEMVHKMPKLPKLD